MKYITIILLLSSITLGCSKKSTPSVSPLNSVDTLTYLALGDSYTIGESVSEDERFPVQLSNGLTAAGIKIKIPRIIARTGWTTDELKKAIIEANIPATTSYDVVTLLIGVNNQYRGRSVEAYKPEFAELLNIAIQFAGGKKERVFVVSIPDYAYTPFGKGNSTISQKIDAFNATNQAITNSRGVTYINITPISREGLKDPSLVASDGLHPSGKQYSRWIQLLLNPVLKSLK